MFGLLSRKVKPPPELVRTTREAMLQLEQSSSGSEPPAKASEEVSRNLSSMKLLLYGEPEQRPNPEAASELAREVWKSDVLRLLLTHLPLLDFECRKDVSQVFSNLLRRQQHGEHETVKWLEENRDVLFILLRGYETPQLALNYGIMLRECARHERLAALLLPTAEEQQFYALFTYIESPYFDVASDAFASLKDLLTKHKPVVAAFLAQHYEPFFQHYHKLVCAAARPNTAPLAVLASEGAPGSPWGGAALAGEERPGHCAPSRCLECSCFASRLQSRRFSPLFFFLPRRQARTTT